MKTVIYWLTIAIERIYMLKREKKVLREGKPLHPNKPLRLVPVPEKTGVTDWKKD